MAKATARVTTTARLAGTVTLSDGSTGRFDTTFAISGAEQPPIEPPPGGMPSNPLAPAPPPQAAVQPGSSGRTLTVGQGYGSVKAAIDAASDGDAIVIPPGTARESFVIHKNLLIDGTGVRWDFSDIPADQLIYQGKAAIVASCPGWHIKGMTISGAGIRESTHTLVAAIRCDAAGYGVIEDCHLTGNQNGAAADTGPLWDITILNCLLDRNGIGDGYTHNAYFNDGYAIRLVNTDSVNPVEGYALKSRAWHTFVLGGTLRNSTASLIDCANGGLLHVSGTLLEKPANSPNRRIFSYGLEYTDKGLLDSNVVVSSVMQLDCNDTFIQLQGGTLTFDAGCTWHGQTPAVDGAGTVVGLPGGRSRGRA